MVDLVVVTRSVGLPIVVSSIEKVCVVAEIYHFSLNKYKAIASKKNVGMAGINLVDNIPIDE